KTTGYYSLIQYCPDPSRLEAANVGVVLFCPAWKYLRAQTTKGNDRIRRFFGSADNDSEQINAMKLSIQRRLEGERDKFREPADLERFAAPRPTAMRLTPPRAVLVEDPDAELRRLFARLIGGRPHREAAQVRNVLEDAFGSKEIAPFIRKKVIITLPVLQQPLQVPYGFQNGRFNLIQPAQFRGRSPGGILERAGKSAMEGELLYHHPDEHLGSLKLIVVGDFAPDQKEVAHAVRDVLRRNETDLYRLDELDQLLDLIHSTGRP